MGWTPITSGVDWQAASFVNEYIAALNERKTVIGQSENLVAEVAAGDDISAATFWGEPYLGFGIGLQSQILAIAPFNFVDPSTASDLTGLTTAAFWTASTFKQAIAGNIGGFRRYTTHPDDGGSVGYGIMQQGDIIGPWIFEDLQSALNKMVWKLGAGSWVNSTSWITPTKTASTLAAAQASALASHPENTSTGTFSPQSYAFVGRNGSSYSASLISRSADVRVSLYNGDDPSTKYACEVDWNINIIPATEFSAGGESWITGPSVYSLLDTSSHAAGPTSLDSIQVGDHAYIMSWPALPGGDPAASSRGLEGDAPLTVIRWDVVNGFEYV